MVWRAFLGPSAIRDSKAGIPIRAHREQSNVTVSVYTYPGWSDLSPGSYSSPSSFLILRLSGGRLSRFLPGNRRGWISPCNPGNLRSVRLPRPKSRWRCQGVRTKSFC